MATTKFANLVKVLCTSTGAGPFHLGAAVSGFRNTGALTDGATYGYSVQQGGSFEVGHGVYDATAQTLTRAVSSSSNGGTAVPFSANAEIAFPLLAEDIPGTPGSVLGPASFDAGTVATSTPMAQFNVFENDGLHPGDNGRTTFRGVNIRVSFNDDNQILDNGQQPALTATVNTPIVTNYDFFKLILPTRGAMTSGAMLPRIDFHDPSDADQPNAFGGIGYGRGLVTIHQGQNADTGQPNPVMQLYYLDYPGITQIEWYAPSTQRLQIRNNGGAIVHVAGNGRFEWENPNGGVRVSFVGYELTEGKTIDFNNTGQPAGNARTPFSVSSVTANTDIATFGSFGGSAWSQLAKIGGSGDAYFPTMYIGATIGTAVEIGASAPAPVTNGDLRLTRSGASNLKLTNGSTGYGTFEVGSGSTVTGVANPALVVKSTTASGAPTLDFKLSDSITYSSWTHDTNTGEMRLGARAGSGNYLSFRINAGTEALRILSNGNVAIGSTGGSFGGAVNGAVFIPNVGTAPTTTPSGGGVMYAEGGALKFKGGSGTVTVIAPA